MESYDPLRPQKAVIVKENPLVFNSEFLSIVVESNRKVFRNSMQGIVANKANFKNKLTTIVTFYVVLILPYFCSPISGYFDAVGSQTLLRSNYSVYHGKC